MHTSRPPRVGSLLSILVVLVACTDGAPPTPTPSATATAAVATAPPETTAAPKTTPTPGPPPYPDVSRPTGIFTEPRTTTPDETKVLGPAPPSVFPTQTRGNTVLYDTRTRQAVDLGQGSVGFFSPDNQLFAWVANFTSQDKPPELWAMNLETDEKWMVSSDLFIGRFVDERTIRARPERTNDWVDIDVFTGTRTPRPAGNPFEPIPNRSGKHELAQDTYDRRTEDWWSVIDHETGQRVLAFQAMRAVVVDENTVAMVTPWTGTSANLFLLDVPTRDASFLATVALTETYYVPLAANERHVVWTEGFCRSSRDIRGKTRIYDRDETSIVELDVSLGFEGFTPDGRLRVGGGFGALSLLNLDPLRYDVVLPEGAGDITWSPDYRYASSGTALGHGGVC